MITVMYRYAGHIVGEAWPNEFQSYAPFSQIILYQLLIS